MSAVQHVYPFLCTFLEEAKPLYQSCILEDDKREKDEEWQEAIDWDEWKELCRQQD